MIQNSSFTPVVNTAPLNSRFLPTTTNGSISGFRAALAKNRGGSTFLTVNEIKNNHGIKMPFKSSVRGIMTQRISEEAKIDAGAEEMLAKLRCMFDIPVIIIGSEDDDIPDSIMRGNTIGTYRKFRISEEMLKRMSDDPELFCDITEKMKRWFDGTSEFLENHKGAIDRMEMYISEYSIMYAYNENFDAPDSEVKNAKLVLNELHDVLLKWMNKWRASDPSSSVSVARMAM